MQRSVSSIAVGLLVIGLLISSATAAVPVLIGHSGRLLDSDDAPISGTIDITYAIFETPTGGTALWTETHPNVEVSNGLFSATLGSIVPLTTDIVAGSGGGGGGAIALERYLEVRIGGDPPISPRTRLAAAPFAVAAGRVDGDIKTGPGIVIVGDTMSNAYATFGEKVQAGLHAAGSALASGAALITSECESGSGNARLAINTKGTGAKRTGVVMEAIADSAASMRCEHDNENDGLIESTVDQNSSANSATIAVKASRRRYNLLDTFPQRIDMSAIADDQTQQSRISQTSDSDGDGVAEVSTTSVCDTGGVSLKLKIDSTPARISTNFTVGKQTQSASFGQRYDSDGDGIPEGEIEQSVTPTTCGLAINVKGTGADANRVLAIQSGATPSELISSASIDDDGDTVPEDEISSIVVPGTCSVAIKSKGTGADKGRAVIQTSSGGLNPGASAVLDSDADGDGIPENEISSIVTPTTCGVAINSKGTGADKNRTISSSCDGDEALHVLTADDDNDGLIDRGVTSSVDTATAQVVASGSDIGVAMKVKNKGVVKGNVTVNNANKVMIDFDSDGLGYVDSSLGIGVAPSHRIDVAGGAYCDGTDWVNASDANAKENFEKVNGAELLDQIADLEITKWNYRGDAGSQHIGPTAQDFQKAFGVGSDGRSISTIDPSGIALAAIKELYAQLKQKDQEVEALRQELAKLRRDLKK